jgi:hypothetical protein
LVRFWIAEAEAVGRWTVDGGLIWLVVDSDGERKSENAGETTRKGIRRDTDK